MANIKTKVFNTKEIVVNKALNVRKFSKYSDEVNALAAAIFQDGGVQIRPLYLVNEDNSFNRVLRGHLRTLSVQQLAEQYPNDRRWDTIEAEIVKGLSPAEIARAVYDQGNVQLLDKAETVVACFLLLDAIPTMTEKELTIESFNLYQLHWPYPAKKDRSPDKVTAHYHGTSGNIMDAWRLPDIAKTQYLSMLSGESNWPQKKEVASLRKLFETERQADASGAITKQNPGPLFMAEWERLEIEHSAQTPRTKGAGMVSRGELTAETENTPSRLIRGQNLTVLRTMLGADIRRTALAGFIAAKIEPLITPELWKEFEFIMNGALPGVPVKPVV